MMVVALAFVGVGAVVRLIPHPPNVAPLTAMALFAGTRFSYRTAAVLAIGAMLAGDLLLGWVAENLMGYVALALTAGVGCWIASRQQRPTAILAGSLAGSLAFFALSNFGVWWVSGMYPRTLAGLSACYVAGVPFYRNQVVGDLAYAAALFGGFAWVCRRCGWSAARLAAVVHP